MKENQSVSVRDHPPILLLILSESLQVNVLLSPLKSSENHMFSDDFRESRS